MRKITTISVLFVFLVSTLYLPITLAEESVVGVVYKDWTEQDCKSTFGNRPEITTRSAIDGMNLIGEYIKFKGPLFYNSIETGCYCGKDAQGHQMVLSADKKSCVYCRVYDASAIYYDDANAVNDLKAAIKVNGQDIGCRCAQKELGAGIKSFDHVEGGKCVYIDKTKQEDACKAQFGASGVRVCTGLTTEAPLGNAVADGKNVACCCEPGFKKSAGTTSTGYQCVKGLGGSPGDAYCAQITAQQNLGELVQCSSSITPKEYGGQYEFATAAAAVRQEFQRTFVGKYGTYSCCCAKDYVKDSSGKCVKEVDDCGKIVEGSVVHTKLDANLNMPIQSSYRDSITGKSWDPEKLKNIAASNLECYCRISTMPFGEKNYLDRCAEVADEKDVVFAVLDEPSFYNLFSKKIFPFARTLTTAQVRIPFATVEEGPYTGGFVLDTGNKDVVVSFHNTDTSRGGRFVAEIVTFVASMAAEGGLARMGAKTLGEAGEQAAARASSELTSEGLMKATAKNLEQKFGVKLSGEAAERAVAAGTREELEAALRASLGATYDDTAKTIGRALASKGPSELATSLTKTGVDDLVAGVAKGVDSLSDDVAARLFVNLGLGAASENPAIQRLAVKGALDALKDRPAELIATLKLASVADSKFAPVFEESLGRSGLLQSAREAIAPTGAAATGAAAAAGGWFTRIFTSQSAKTLAFGSPSTLLSIYGPTIGRRLLFLLQNGWGPLIMIAASEIDVSEVKSATGMASPGEAVKQGLKTLGLSLAISLGVGLITGGVGLVPALVGSLVAGVGVGLMEGTETFGDPTTMEIRFNDRSVGDKIYNLLITDDSQKCNAVTDNSGLRLLSTKLNVGGNSDFNGWSLREVTLVEMTCTLLNSKSLKATGGYTQTELMPGGHINYCTGCHSIDLGSNCNSKSTKWDEENKLRSIGVSRALCCAQCKTIGNVNLGEYYGTPSGAVSNAGLGI